MLAFEVWTSNVSDHSLQKQSARDTVGPRHHDYACSMSLVQVTPQALKMNSALEGARIVSIKIWDLALNLFYSSYTNHHHLYSLHLDPKPPEYIIIWLPSEIEKTRPGQNGL